VLGFVVSELTVPGDSELLIASNVGDVVVLVDSAILLITDAVSEDSVQFVTFDGSHFTVSI